MTDAAGLAIGLAGTVLKLVVFSIEFVGDAKQVYKQGATDHNFDLATVVKSVEDATTSLEEQLDAIGKNGFGEKPCLDPDEEVSSLVSYNHQRLSGKVSFFKPDFNLRF
jgi:hypothetical protein